VKRGNAFARCSRAVAVTVLALGFGAGPMSGQTNLADYDYENLAFRGIGFDVGYIVADRVESTVGFGLRADLGYLGPSFRLTPRVSYWSSTMEASEVRELRDQLEILVRRSSETNAEVPDINLGVIDWSDLMFGLDGHFVWRIPAARLLTYAGAGVALHVMNGSGAAVNGTFVEDLLDSWSAGLNVHTGLEVPLSDRLRVYGTAKYQIQGDLRYFDFRLGTQIMIGESLPGEQDGP
jgi:hypothetical protein